MWYNFPHANQNITLFPFSNLKEPSTSLFVDINILELVEEAVKHKSSIYNEDKNLN